MSDTAPPDAMTQIEDAILGFLRARLGPAFRRYLREEQLPVAQKLLPACVVIPGDEERPERIGRAEGGEWVVLRRMRLDVLVVCDDTEEAFRVASRRLAEDVRAAMADFRAIPLPLDDVEPGPVRIRVFDSTEGNQGGFHLAFTVEFTTREITPGVLEPRH
ncbi:hypothetical protein [Methylorubrum sp. DB1722]|uniref:hypothetical protein n=1 Tax=Methylorubrum sp. DB1722 TaxID=2478916 RepID=UPI0018E3E38A|nr:hypothetical protein [Methylorubrum sp. DB1722]MBI1689530.1 hypothetical protein [Methylorubrum sp. DB1722]